MELFSDCDDVSCIESEVVLDSEPSDLESILTTSSLEFEKAIFKKPSLKIKNTNYDIKECFVKLSRISLTDGVLKKFSSGREKKSLKNHRGVRSKRRNFQNNFKGILHKNKKRLNNNEAKNITTDTRNEKNKDQLTKEANCLPTDNSSQKSNHEKVQIEEIIEVSNKAIRQLGNDHNEDNRTINEQNDSFEKDTHEVTMEHKNETHGQLDENLCKDGQDDNQTLIINQDDKENNNKENENELTETSTNTERDTNIKIKKLYPKKQTFCVFCRQLKTNIARHFELLHSDEVEVQNYLKLEKQSSERKQIIADLRNKGNFEYNINNSNKPIVARRRHKLAKPHDVENYYLPCPNCMGYFSHQNISRHHDKCAKRIRNFPQDQTRTIKRSARTLVTKIHRAANSILKRRIFPPMRRDKIFNTMIKDKLILLYGNHLTAKYTGHQEFMVRNYLRFVTRYFLIIQQLCPDITKFSALFKPRHFDVAMQAIVNLAGLNEDTGKYRSPKSALQMVHNLKVCSNVLQSQYIKEGKMTNRKRVQNFMMLLNTDAPGLINKQAVRSLIDNKRKKLNVKQVKIPLSEDIQKFKAYLLEKCDSAYRSLIIDGFNYTLWKKLAEMLLLYLVVFNRKRSGEIHKILVEDFLTIHQLSDTSLPELYEMLNEKDKSMANDFYKIIIRGKLDSAITVFVPAKIKLYLDYINTHRQDASVPENNPYLFGLPGKLSGERYRLLETCSLMRRYTEMAQLTNPNYMRTTLLRKHLATRVSALNLEEAKQKTVIDFMGHQEHIHKRFYRQEVVTKDLMMTQILGDDLGTSRSTCIESERSTSKTSVCLEGQNDINDVENSDPGPSGIKVNSYSNNDKSDNDYSEIQHTTPKKTLPVRNTRPIKSVQFNQEMSEEPVNYEGDDDDDWVIGSEASDGSEKTSKVSRYRNRKVVWSTPERQVARQIFGTHIQDHQLPSEEYCRTIIDEQPVLAGRTAMQLKAWVYNQIKNVHYRKTRVRERWTTPQKAVMRNIFSEHIKNPTYPSTKECQEAKAKYPELKEKNVVQMKSFIQHSKKLYLKQQLN